MMTVAGSANFLKTDTLFTVIVLYLSLTSCNYAASVPGSDAAEPQTSGLSWQSGPEDSKFALEKSDGFAIRCWKINTKFDCLSVTDAAAQTEAVMGKSAYSFVRGTVSTLPESILNVDGNGAYICGYRGDSMQEEIYRDGELLTSKSTFFNLYDAQDAPWSESFVENLGKENGLSWSRPYLPCRTLGTILSDGSLSTLGTSLVKHKFLR